MIHRIALGAAAALLVIGMPVAALGISRVDLDSSQSVAQAQIESTQQIQATASSVDVAVVADQSQTRVQQQLRIHAETGVPEGVTPTQTRQGLHTENRSATQAQTRTSAGNGDLQGTQPGDGTGNQFGRNGGGHGGNGGSGAGMSGECTNPDGPVGSGPQANNG